jgi:protein TonB
MTPHSLRRSILVLLACVLFLPRTVWAQTLPAEADLLARLLQQPREVATLLDLAKIYERQGRFDEADGVLRRAMAALQQEALRAGTPVPIRVGSDVKEPRKTYDVPATYPPIAETAGVKGIVVVEVTAGPSGQVTDAKILRPIALLNQAALDAVRQWRYTPTLLNGVPTPVRFSTTVRFPDQGTNVATPGTMATSVAPIRVFGGVREPRRLTYVAPVYPELARAANVEGVVIIEVTVDPQGHVTEPRVLRSIALLDQAALDAVRQWTYAPTVLNGVPVAVVMVVTVTFSR